MEQAIQLIRSLNSRFRVVSRDQASLIMHVDSARIGGHDVSCVIEFHALSGNWASQWDSAENLWKTRPDLAAPTEGKIDEASIKPAGDGYSLSFAERCDPLVRWGFFAESASVRVEA